MSSQKPVLAGLFGRRSVGESIRLESNCQEEVFLNRGVREQPYHDQLYSDRVQFSSDDVQFSPDIDHQFFPNCVQVSPDCVQISSDHVNNFLHHILLKKKPAHNPLSLQYVQQLLAELQPVPLSQLQGQVNHAARPPPMVFTYSKGSYHNSKPVKVGKPSPRGGGLGFYLFFSQLGKWFL